MLNSNHPDESNCQQCRTNPSLCLGGRGEPAPSHCEENTTDFEWVTADLHRCA